MKNIWFSNNTARNFPNRFLSKMNSVVLNWYQNFPGFILWVFLYRTRQISKKWKKRKCLTWSWKHLSTYYVLSTPLHIPFWGYRAEQNHFCPRWAVSREGKPTIIQDTLFFERDRHTTRGSHILKHHTQRTGKFRVSELNKGWSTFMWMTFILFKKNFF